MIATWIVTTTAAESETEGGGNRLGAGAASEPVEGQPRAKAKRGRDGNGETEFYVYLSRMPPHTWWPLAALGVNARGPKSWAAPNAVMIGEFKQQARWTVRRFVTSRVNVNEPNRTNSNGIEGDDGGLAAILSAIEAEVHQFAAALRDGVMAEFAAMMQHARKTLLRDQVAGAVAALKQRRDAALAFIKRNAAAQLKGRREAAMREHRKIGRSRCRLRPPGGPSRS